MNWMRTKTTQATRRKSLRHSLLTVVLSGFLVLSLPVPARADIVTSLADVAGLVANWASDHASMLLDIAQSVWAETATAIEMAVPIMTKAVNSNIETSLNQGEADGELRAKQTAAAGDESGDSLVPTETRLCSLTHAAQEASVARAISKQQVGKLASMSAGRGVGPVADTSSPAYTASEVNDLCKLGFLDTSANGRYGLLPKNMGCTTLTGADTRYVDADMRLSSVIGKLQYPLPNMTNVTIKKDGHVSFIGVNTAETAAGLGSEMDYAAAYKFCEHLQPELPTPTHSSTKPTTNDIASMSQFSKASSLRTSAAEECFRSLAYRTSCPAGSATSLQATTGVGASCHEAQVQLCARLTSSHKQGGLELTMTGDNPVFAAALANCASEGISPAMYDAITANRCHDRNYSLRVLPVIMGDGPALERARAFECPEYESDYRSKMNDEKMRLLVAIKNLLVMRAQ